MREGREVRRRGAKGRDEGGSSLKSKYILIGAVLISLASAFWLRSGPRTPAGMILIPAGEFTMGTDEAASSAEPISNLSQIRSTFIAALPAHTVYLDSFYIDRSKVTYREYQTFAEATRRPLSFDPNRADLDQPMTGIDWQEVADYCRWNQKRLPTEEEWEKAARGAGAAFREISNGWEWTADRYRPYPNNPYRDDAFWKGYRALRGGLRRGESGDAARQIAARFYADPKTRNGRIGFRCARSL